ncbi:MAG: MotA/TolQ/ExbB proton channel family protein, partial [Syntrophaceae bacterium]|nr:MotA/TolQ/ExbB proton channel family protein [Syntrophaceae bacterium]
MESNFHGSLLGMILDAGLMVKFVLLILLVFSIISWTIIFIKFRTYRRIRQENEAFDSDYQKSTKLSDLLPTSRKYPFSTTAEVFRAGYAEMTKANRLSRDSARPEEISLSSLDNVERALNRASSTEMTKLESALGFLATTGSASPFIGLFGTVW